jgi:segregation and condensation protein B
MEIRGVQGAGVLKTLLDRKLIVAAGRKQVIGKPVLYKTTREFLVQFGLKDLSELPTLKEFEEIRRLSIPDSEQAPPPEQPAETVAAEPAHSDPQTLQQVEAVSTQSQEQAEPAAEVSPQMEAAAANAETTEGETESAPEGAPVPETTIDQADAAGEPVEGIIETQPAVEPPTEPAESETDEVQAMAEEPAIEAEESAQAEPAGEEPRQESETEADPEQDVASQEK